MDASATNNQCKQIDVRLSTVLRSTFDTHRVDLSTTSPPPSPPSPPPPTQFHAQISPQSLYTPPSFEETPEIPRHVSSSLISTERSQCDPSQGTSLSASYQSTPTQIAALTLTPPYSQLAIPPSTSNRSLSTRKHPLMVHNRPLIPYCRPRRPRHLSPRVASNPPSRRCIQAGPTRAPQKHPTPACVLASPTSIQSPASLRVSRRKPLPKPASHPPPLTSASPGPAHSWVRMRSV